MSTKPLQTDSDDGILEQFTPDLGTKQYTGDKRRHTDAESIRRRFGIGKIDWEKRWTERKAQNRNYAEAGALVYRKGLLPNIIKHAWDPDDAELLAGGTDWLAVGPPGSGKSAIVSALFDRLDERVTASQSVIHTSTRVQNTDSPAFVYLDARAADSQFRLYHATLSAMTDEPVPEQGVSTRELRSRLRSRLAGESGAVVAVDHVGEPRTMSGSEVYDHFEEFGNLVSLFAVGQSRPDGEWCETHVEIPAYGQQVLIDILMTRASTGLAGNVFTHQQAQELANWAGGNAHDALSALFGAADTADRLGNERLTAADVRAGMDAVPRPSVSLGRVLTLAANRQLVLRELIDLPENARQSVTATTEALAERPRVDLSASTIRRFLYELAEAGIVDRIQAEQSDGQGRPPSRIELRFPTIAFERLYDMQW